MVDIDPMLKIYRYMYVCVCACVSCSVMPNSARPWTTARQAPLSVMFPRQEYGSGLPCSSPGDRPDPGIELGSPPLQADSLPSGPPGKSIYIHTSTLIFLYMFLF